MKVYIHCDYLDGHVTECKSATSALSLLFAIIVGLIKAIKVEVDSNGYDHYYIFDTLDL